MKINFFEEFPTKENLDKLKLIKFPIGLVIAAESLKEFSEIKNKIKNKYVKEIVYWPILNENEGYWFSAFTENKGLKRVIEELKEGKNELGILWDAELPLLNKSLFYNQIFNFFNNKKMINNFLKNTNENIILCEYVSINWFADLMLKFFAVRFDNLDYKKIIMAYSSMAGNFDKNLVENQIKLGKKKYKDFCVGLGVIAKGKPGNEPIMSYEELERDLRACKSKRIEEVYIFRLGGLDKEYVKVIEKYANLS